jgi:hypothetical protein
MSARTLVRRPDLVIPAFAHNGGKPKRGMVQTDLRKLGVLLGVGGGDRGFNAGGDVVTQTADGRPLNDLWTEFQQTLAINNEQRQRIIDFLTFPVVNVIEDVLQAGTGADFEVATEYGEPVGVRTKMAYFSMSYDFQWYDLAARFTWKYLAEATAQQVESVHQAVLEADNRNVFTKVMRTVFNSTNLAATINGNAYNVYKFYNADGTVPPQYKTTTFDGSHTHYFVSGAATVDSGDVEQLQTALQEHGYSRAAGATLILMVNKSEGDAIRLWRLGVENSNSAVANYDFIPARGLENLVFSATQQVVGTQVPNTLAGLAVIGTYGDFVIVQDDYIPSGYMFAFATGGPSNLSNPVGFRQHVNTSLRGLRLVKGPNADYPLVDSFYNRGFGTGIRQRGGGAVMKIAASGSYAPPAIYA